MTITLTIDTHPHSNALIPDQVRSIVEAALQKAKLGTILSHSTENEIDKLKEELEASGQSVDRLRDAVAAIEERLEKAEKSLLESNDAPALQGLELVQEALKIANES